MIIASIHDHGKCLLEHTQQSIILAFVAAALFACFFFYRMRESGKLTLLSTSLVCANLLFAVCVGAGAASLHMFVVEKSGGSLHTCNYPAIGTLSFLGGLIVPWTIWRIWQSLKQK